MKNYKQPFSAELDSSKPADEISLIVNDQIGHKQAGKKNYKNSVQGAEDSNILILTKEKSSIGSPNLSTDNYKPQQSQKIQEEG